MSQRGARPPPEGVGERPCRRPAAGARMPPRPPAPRPSTPEPRARISLCPENAYFPLPRNTTARPSLTPTLTPSLGTRSKLPCGSPPIHSAAPATRHPAPETPPPPPQPIRCAAALAPANPGAREAQRGSCIIRTPPPPPPPPPAGPWSAQRCPTCTASEPRPPEPGPRIRIASERPPIPPPGRTRIPRIPRDLCPDVCVRRPPPTRPPPSGPLLPEPPSPLEPLLSESRPRTEPA